MELQVGNSSNHLQKKSERILKKSAFSKFTNEASNPVLIDIDISSSPSKEHIIPPSKKFRFTKASITSSPFKKVTGFAADTVVPMEGPLHIHSEIRSKKRNDHSTQTDVPIKTPITIKSNNKSKERKEKALQVEAVNDVPIKTPITIKSNTKSKERKEKALQVEAVNDKKKRRTSTVEVLKPLSVSDSDFEDSVPNVKKKQVCLKKTKKLPKLISKKKQPQVKPKTKSQLELLYLEKIRCDGVPVERGIPSLCFWSVDDMVTLQDFEIKNGGFGSGEFQEFIVPNDSQPKKSEDNVDASVDCHMLIFFD
ncbi:hypothetical protein L1887_07166 [Cichorium endivia]|nr:hypothetical protein L1887_07166 [Cichorium endivia]